MADATKEKAAPVVLTDAGKLRLVYLLFMHQKTPINYKGFDAGTGHSEKAVSSLMDRLKKQFSTDAKPGDAAALVATGADKLKATPKKRAAAPKTAMDGEEGETAETPSKKARKSPVKKAADGEKATPKKGRATKVVKKEAEAESEEDVMEA